MQEADAKAEVHRNLTRLIEGTINASLSWDFSLSSDLTFDSVSLGLGAVGIAVVDGPTIEVLEGFKDKYAINWIPNQRITLVIFRVTTEHNNTFVCEIIAKRGTKRTWTSNVQVDVVGKIHIH